MAAKKVAFNVSLAALKTIRPNVFDPSKPASRLPEEYKKFWKEWQWQEPAPVHYIPETGKWKRNPETGEVSRVENVPLPLKFAPEMDKMLLGGEGIVKGFQKRHQLRRRVPKFWVPVLKRSVVYSEVLGSYMPVILTERVLQLIHDHHGFDFYLLQTPACDLKTELALKIKRSILLALAKKECWQDNPKKQEEVLEKYSKYIIPEKEAEWYGLTMKEAMIKQHLLEQKPIQPLKLQYRKELIQQLTETGVDNLSIEDESKSGSWLTKINPFGAKETTSKE